MQTPLAIVALSACVPTGQRLHTVLLFAVQLVCTTLLALQAEQRIHGVPGLESSSHVLPRSQAVQTPLVIATLGAAVRVSAPLLLPLPLPLPLLEVAHVGTALCCIALLSACVPTGQRRQAVLLFAVQFVCTTLLALQAVQRIHGVPGLESSSHVLPPSQAVQTPLAFVALSACVPCGQRRQAVLLSAVQFVCTTLLALQVEQRIHGVPGSESSSHVLPRTQAVQALELLAPDPPNVPLLQRVHFVKLPATPLTSEYRPRLHSKHRPFVPWLPAEHLLQPDRSEFGL